jgi:hypothetical protein
VFHRAQQASDYLNFADLQGLTNFSTAVSPDGGQDFQGGPMPAGPPQSCNPITTTGTLVDRQWLGLLGDPRGAPGNGSKVFLDFDFVGALDCATGANSANSTGNEFVIQRSGDGGNTLTTMAFRTSRWWTVTTHRGQHTGQSDQ